VFDPLAIALIIAFNGLIDDKKAKQRKILTEMMENDQKLGLYEVYGDKREDLVENNLQKEDFSGKNLPIEAETPIIVENAPLTPNDALIEAFETYNSNLDLDNDGIVSNEELSADSDGDGVVSEEEKRKWYEDGGWRSPYDGKAFYHHPWFDWSKRERWINDRKAIDYWLSYQGGTQAALEEYKKTP
jgi:hypothetical protein